MKSNETFYLNLVTWPDGTEGLLFPRPGNVPLSTTPEAGESDFNIARTHLMTYVLRHPEFKGTSVSLVECRAIEVLRTATDIG